MNFYGVLDNLSAERDKHLISLLQCISETLHLISNGIFVSVSAAGWWRRRPTVMGFFGRRPYLDRSGLRRHFWTGLSFLFALEEVVRDFFVGFDLLLCEADVLLRVGRKWFLTRLFCEFVNRHHNFFAVCALDGFEGLFVEGCRFTRPPHPIF